MVESRFFPVSCPEGHAPFLAEVSVTAEMPLLECPVCKAPGRLIPGAYYTAATRERFQRIAAVIYDAGLTSKDAAIGGALLDPGSSATRPEAVLELIEQNPGLLPLRELVPREARDMPAFVGLVCQLLATYAPPESARSAKLESAAVKERERTAG